MKLSKNDNLIRDLVNDPNYIICENGKIFTKITLTGKVGKNWRELRKNYAGNSILIRYKNKKLLLHRVIFQKFGGELEKDKIINHKDYNSYNNDISNLEQITYGENQIHRFKNDIANYGNSKINFEIAKDILKKQREGWTNKELRDYFKVSKSLISDIVNKKVWLCEKPKKINKDNRVNDKTRIVKWSQIEEIEKFYQNKPKGTSVDHIIPLHNPNVCGLHVLENLQYLPEQDNFIKGNQFDYTQENNSWKNTKKS